MFKNLRNMWLFNILLEFKDAYISVFIFSAAINIIILVPAWYMLQVYDRVLTSYDDNTLIGLSLIAVFLYLIYGLLEKYRRLILNSSTEGLDEKILNKIETKFVQGDHYTTKKLHIIFKDLNIIKQFLTGMPILSFIDIPWFFLFITVLFLMHFHLGLIALVAVCILFFLAFLNQKLAGQKYINASSKIKNENRLISNIVYSSESSFVMGMNKSLFHKVIEARDDHNNSTYNANIDSTWIYSSTKFFRIFIQSAILGYAAYLAINEEISFGMIIAASILLGRTLSPIEGVINNWKIFLEFKKSFINLNNSYEKITSDDTTINLGEPDGLIESSKTYVALKKEEEPILKNINLKILPGECVVILGPSGSGKTTLLKTLCGIYKPTHGTITLDGTRISNRNQSDIGNYFGYVSQSPTLLKGKISENIARFDKVDSKEVIEASKKINIHDYIIKLPKGYETELGDHGSGLSDGQTRRIAIARAIYKNPKIYFLDEPNLALDHESLLSLLNLIKYLKSSNKTVIFSTHNPALSQLAEKAILIINGEIKAYGNTKEIITKLAQKKNDQIN
jgi:PrtD family type I secretion system ABC transporter